MFRFIVALSVLCLASAVDLDDRIVNGKTVSVMEFPYQVSIQQYGSHFCGGSILSPEWILTAAHCMAGKESPQQMSNIQVRLGSSTWNQGGTVKRVERVINHPEYNPQTVANDVALIKVVGTIPYSAVMKPVSLPTTATPTGACVQVSGWGYEAEQANTIPTTLKAVELQSLTSQVCGQNFAYGAKRITPEMFCATGPSKDSCQGDSGGPLVLCGSRVQVGIVSWGAGCAQAIFPGVYTNIIHPKIRSFISRYTGL